MSQPFAVSILLASALALPISAKALDVKKVDDVVFMSGDLDPKDRSTLKNALTGARALVVGQVGGGGMVDHYRSFAVLIKDSGVPTVASGQCGFFCTYFFMAGKQRLFGVSVSEPKKPVMVLISTIPVHVIDGTTTPWEGHYALLSGQFGPRMPGSLLRKYTEKTRFPEGMLAFPPSAKHPEGYFRECTDVRDGTTCTNNQELTPLNTGMITSAELFPVPSP